jgi:alkyl hydroperoxide reductase subunit AhpC
VTAFVYEWERYLEGKVQILGVSVEPADEGKKLLERVTRDCQEDRPHIPLDPYPVRLLTDPEATLIRAVGAENEGHWAGLIAAPITYVVDPAGTVRWAYVSDSAADRPSPVALAKAAVSVASGKAPPANYPGKS